MCTNPILRCFDNLEGLNNGDFLVSAVLEFMSWLMVSDLAAQCLVGI
jgi:hypothetical protein